MLLFKSKPVESTPLSEFIRNASAEEKKKVYSQVLKRASESQKDLIERVGGRKTPCAAG